MWLPSPRVRFGHGSTLVGVAWTCLAWVWLAAILSAPLVASPANESAGLVTAPHGSGFARMAVAVYDIGARLCHQRPARSFHWRGVQAPVCGRCLGIYASLAVGLLAGWFLPPRTRTMVRQARSILAMAAVPTVVSLIVEWVVGADPGNVLRALSAVPGGFVVGWLVIVALTRPPVQASPRVPSLAQRAL